MNKLEECRIKIDELDSKIAQLYEFRMSIVKEVVKYKIQEGLPVLDEDRETEMLTRNVKNIQNDEYKSYYKTVLKGFLDASKDMQMDIFNAMNKE